MKDARQERIIINPDSSGSSGRKDAEKTWVKKCKLCDESFTRSSDFENHMVDKHDTDKMYTCEVCGKKFLLKWRLKVHGFNHTEETKVCKYFLKNEHCPFNTIGCKFSHKEDSANAEMVKDVSEIEDVDDTDVESEDDYNFIENQCHLCRMQYGTRDYLWEHVESSQEEYFQGMLEVAQANRS